MQEPEPESATSPSWRYPNLLAHSSKESRKSKVR